MAYPFIKISMIGILFAVCLLNGCTRFIEDGEAWPGVSAATVSSAPDFTAPVGGGQFGQRTPPDVLQNTNGYRGEDMAATAPGIAGGANGLYSYDSSMDNSAAAQKNNGEAGSSATSFSSETAQATEAPVGESDDPSDPVENWIAREGDSVRTLLTEWGEKAGWYVVWNTDREYILEAGAMFRGRFMDVASALIRSFARARPSPWGTFYKGNRVLLVTTLEDENAD